MNKQIAFRQFRDYLHREGKNITSERLCILEAVMGKKGHFRIEDIIDAKSGGRKPVSRATVYRTIKTIEAAGLIKYIRSIHDEKIYEVVKEHHEHMICEACGKIIEFHDAELESRQRKICRDHDFLPRQHSTKIFGICQACRKEHSGK